MKVIDSSGWVQLFMNGPLSEVYLHHSHNMKDIITPTIVVYEVYKKMKSFFNDDNVALEYSGYLSKTNVVSLDDTLAVEAANLSIEDKLGMADAIIYATALSRGAQLVTSDADFKNLPGVLFLDPEEK